MPRNVRNFWVETTVDGSSTGKGTGPVSKDGGFQTVIKMRRNGEIVPGYVITGRVNAHGQLIITVQEGESGAEVSAKASER